MKSQPWKSEAAGRTFSDRVRAWGTLAALLSVAAPLSPMPTTAAEAPAQAAPANATPSLDGPVVLNTTAGRIRIVPIRGFVYPWALAFLPNGDMLVTEQGRNTLRRVSGGTLDPTPISGLPVGIQSTRRDTAGVDIIVHPRFSENHWIYVAYWKPHPRLKGTKTATVVRARYDGGSTLADVREIFESSSWTDGPGAARMAWANDGKLFLAIGAPGFVEEVGSVTHAQDPAEHAGKILRLNDDGSAPADNPFAGRAGFKPEIYALGIRNSLGLAIHPRTGALWISDNGPQGGDEIDVIGPGLNYGWPQVTYGRAYASDVDGKRSGLPPPSVQPPTSAAGMEEPFTFYKPSISASGLLFYTGDKFPLWRGSLLVGGLVGLQLSRITFNTQGLEARREALLLELRQRIRDVRQGPDGLIYLTTDMADGAVLRLEPLEGGDAAR